MNNKIYISIVRRVILILIMMISLSGTTQEKYTVLGKVTVENNEIENTYITILKGEEKLSVIEVNPDGNFELKLDFGHEFILKFSKEGFVTKQISISTYVPYEILKENDQFSPFKLEILLLPLLEGIDTSIFNKPMALIMYNSELNEFAYNKSYAIQFEKSIRQAEEKVEEQALEKKYNAIIALGDKQMGEKKCHEAKISYNEALNLNSEKNYPKTQIKKIDDLLAEISRIKTEIAKLKAELLPLIASMQEKQEQQEQQIEQQEQEKEEQLEQEGQQEQEQEKEEQLEQEEQQIEQLQEQLEQLQERLEQLEQQQEQQENILKEVKKQNKFGIKFSGFVKNDIFFDSRQTVTAREGHLLLWPAAESLDAEGKDVNEKSNFNFLSLQSRLKGTISGPDAFGAKTSGVIEGAFFGSAESGMNNFRLRHAFVKFNWTNTELLVGQYWHAMFVTDCFPGTVSFNTGLPFQPFSRNPQIRLTQKNGNMKFIVAAQSQRDFSSRGPAGTTSSYLRNSGVPDMQFQIHYGSKNEESGNSIVTGLGMGYKTILPRLYTEVTTNEVTTKYKTDETVSSLSALGFLKLTTPKVTFKLEGVYGENGCDHLSIGGIAEKAVTDATRGFVSYTPIRETSVWTDIHSNGKNFQVGLFAGYTKNLGTKDEITGSIYGLGTNIASLYRVSPRMIFNSGKARFAAELEYTSAAYGTPNNKAVPKNTTDVGNLRFLLGVYYFF